MHKFVFILFCSILLSQICFAQDSKYVYEDSTLQQPPVVVEEDTVYSEKSYEEVKREQQQTSDDDETDTTLFFNKLGMSADSMENWKNARAFRYARIIFWILAGIFVLFIIYRLFLADGIFKKVNTAKDNVVPIAAEEIITAESDFDSFIQQAVAEGNYRLAIRYHFLKTL